jgi:hypothetical protein
MTETDVSKQAQKEGIELPVTLSAPLVQRLVPNSFLTSIGIDQEQRIVNLLRLIHAHLKIETRETTLEGRCAIPFMALRGPLVCEEFLPIIATVDKNDEGKPVITVTLAKDNQTE